MLILHIAVIDAFTLHQYFFTAYKNVANAYTLFYYTKWYYGKLPLMWYFDTYSYRCWFYLIH